MKFEPSWICFFQQDDTKGLSCAGGFNSVNAAAHCQTLIIRIFCSCLDVHVSSVCELCREGDGGIKGWITHTFMKEMGFFFHP